MKTIGRVALFPVKLALFSVGAVVFTFAFWVLVWNLPMSDHTPALLVLLLGVAFFLLWAWVLSGLKHLLIRR